MCFMKNKFIRIALTINNRSSNNVVVYSTSLEDLSFLSF